MLKGKCALVTGGSRGIGRAIAIEYAKNGADVAILYAGNTQAAEETAAACAEYGVRAEIYQCDVASYEGSEAAVKAVLESFGGVDILVNNAGITRDKLLLQMKEEDFDSVVDTNLKGAFHMIRHLYKNFMKKRGGSIINVSSVAGIMGNAGQANYSASKAGLLGLTKTVAKELAGRNVSCNAIAPGFVETDMTQAFAENEQVLHMIPMGRMGKPEEIAALAAFLASDNARYITGEVIRMDGGIAM